jgi:hypothetical protein
MDMLRALGAAAAGAVAMYALDPDMGRRRRALVRDRLVHAAHKTTDAVDTTSRDLTNRARGVVADIRGRFHAADVSDEVLAERVRARIGAVVGHGSAIDVGAENGRVVLTGPVLAEEIERLRRRVLAVRGVKVLDDRLEVHATPGNIPGLQGRPRTPRGGEVFELWQENWSPTARLLTSLAGIVMIGTGLRRFDLIGLTVAFTGFGLLSRAATNTSISRGVETLQSWRTGER